MSKILAASFAASVAALSISESVHGRPLEEAREIAAAVQSAQEEVRSASAEPAETASTPARPGKAEPRTVCELIETAAAEHDIPVEFFTRLIWKESNFRSGAVSPKGAQGIAQFMPMTAAERGLRDPFDPAQAIPASASLLRDLRAQFGNLGLAAAAYNAGARRVTNWLGKRGGLPWETRDYVAAITGKQAEDWAALARRKVSLADGEPQADEPDAKPMTCLELAALLSRPGAGAQVAAAANPVWAPWGVQVAGNFSQSRALASYALLQRKHAAVLGQVDPMVVPTRNHSRGNATFYDIRVPAQSRGEAQEICRKLKSSGGSCIVQRN